MLRHSVLCLSLLAPAPLWAQTLQLEATINAHKDYVSQLVFSADNAHILSTSADRTLKRFSLTGQQLVSVDEYPEPILAMATTDLGNDVYVAGGSLDKAGPYPLFRVDAAASRQFGRIQDGAVLERFEPHPQAILALALTSDGTGLASADASGIVRIWNGIPLSKAKYGFGGISDNIQNSLEGIQQLQDKLKAKQEGRVYEPPKSKPVGELKVGAGLSSLAFATEGGLIAGAGFDKQVHLYQKGKFSPLGAHEARVLAVAWIPRTKTVISAGADGSLKVWDALERKEFYSLPKHTSAIYTLAVSPDGTLLAAGAKDGALIVYDLGAKTERYRMTDATGYVRSVAFAPGGHLLASGDKAGVVRVYRMPGTRSLDKLDLAFGNTEEPPLLVVDAGVHSDRVSEVIFSKDGKEIITGSWDKTIRVWDAGSGQLVRVIRLPAYPGNEGMIYSMALSPDGRFLAVGGASVQKEVKRIGGEYVLMIDYATGEIVDVAAYHFQVIFSVAFSGDGKRLISGAGTGDEKALVYSVSNDGKLTLETGGQMPSDVLSVALSKDGKTAYLADQGGLLVRTTVDKTMKTTLSKSTQFKDDKLKNAKGEEVHMMEGEVIGKSLMRAMSEMMGKKMMPNGGYSTLAVDPTGAYVAVCDNRGIVQGYEATPGSLKGVEVGAAGVTLAPDDGFNSKLGEKPGVGVCGAMDFSPDGKRIAFSRGNVVSIFDVVTHKELARFTKHTGLVGSVAFSPDGKRVGSASIRTSEAYVWDSETGNEVHVLGKRANVAISALGVHKSDATMIGFSTGDNKKVSKAFDVKNLRVVAKVDAADFVTGADSNAKLKPREPTIPPDGMAGTKLKTYLGLPNGLVIYSTEYKVLYDQRYTRDLSQLGIPSDAMALGTDGNTFYVGYSDGRIEIYDQAQLKLVATLLIGDDDEWLLFTPDGYYAASKNGSRRVGWLLNAGVKHNPKYYPFEQFDLRLNRPDIVLTRLMLPGTNAQTLLALKKGHDKRLAKMGLKPEALQMRLQAPTVTLAKVPPTVKTKSVPISITAKSASAPLTKAHIYVNDVPLFGSQGTPATGTSWSKKLSLALTPGRNKIQVTVMDASGIESNKETTYVTCQAPEGLGDLYVVTIGVSDYNDAKWKLDFAAKDARDLAATLKGKEKLLYKKLVLVPLLDKQATKESILAAKKTLMKSKPDDEVVLFIAGHGLLDDKDDYYFATVDVDFAKPNERGLPYEAIEGLLDGIPARKKLLLMDTCHSGEVEKEELPPKLAGVSVKVPGTRGMRRTGTQPAQGVGVNGLNALLGTLFTDLRRGSGAMVISSASGAQLAMEGGGFANGVFTYALLDGLQNKKADKNSDGSVRVGELRDYVVETVTTLTQGQQTPTARRENLEFDFRVY